MLYFYIKMHLLAGLCSDLLGEFTALLDQMCLKIEIHWVVGSFIKLIGMLSPTLLAQRLQLTPSLL